MPNIKRMGRVLYRHQWTCLDEWVQALDDLADLNDEAVDEVVREVQRDAGQPYFE